MSSLATQATLTGKTLFTCGASFSIAEAAHAMQIKSTKAAEVLSDMFRTGGLERTQVRPSRYRKPGGGKALLSRKWV